MAEQLANWFAEGLDEQAVWSGLNPGPTVDEVAARLASTPQPFLADTVDVVALACDVFNHTGCAAAAQRIAERGTPASRRGAAIGLWLFASADLIGPFSVSLDERRAATALLALAFRVAPLVEPGRWLSDSDRRDEAVRTFLLWDGLLPHGEDAVQARSLFEMRDSVRREGALAQALADHEHRMAVQRRLADAKAKEAAARYNSE
ncbi:hypothetical protein BA059_03845 [Mycolicibacterium sp. (ex Dasyatis americana)]|uniref:Phosphohydrolase n=1 Tax=Mycobacterium syngnathidarum TaxID=1908205 RepID=A0A1Q9W7Q2_9MYCO|nr:MULTISPECIES: hypothetical protein [Mycobacterium]OFB43073.1 hypothetical protein BA059_03845 [Mycolicibacterium sp. (ex Dasyatis americana)]OHT92282.1 hypothetical protein BKG61_24740 [Mycobacterium syngnathidarum]OLT94156.1 hypothetical protein BKG60_19440 [Mycobacterium syngnathidarum]